MTESHPLERDSGNTLGILPEGSRRDTERADNEIRTTDLRVRACRLRHRVGNRGWLADNNKERAGSNDIDGNA